MGSTGPLTLVVMAAGIGSRYGGLKQIDPIGPSGEIILDYSVYDALRAGFVRVVFVIRRDIESDFRETVGARVEPRVDTHYVFQELTALPEGYSVPAGRKKPWGTAHAVLTARDAVPGAFAAINADDFYGAGAFAAVGTHLAAGVRSGAESKREDTGYCMAGYRLDHTLSEHGHVSRGVCEVTADGFLRGIVERETIRMFGDVVKYEGPDGWVDIPGDTPVSMNIWGFPHGFFRHLESGFAGFLSRRVDEEGSECYLPAVVNDLIECGLARVRVLPTDERWFGITHREDRPVAEGAVRERIARGVYPERLWG